MGVRESLFLFCIGYRRTFPTWNEQWKGGTAKGFLGLMVNIAAVYQLPLHYGLLELSLLHLFPATFAVEESEYELYYRKNIMAHLGF